VIRLRHRQPSLWHSGLAKDIEDLWEPWMKEVDQLLEHAALAEGVYHAQGKRHPNSRTHGRHDLVGGRLLYWRTKLRSCRRERATDGSMDTRVGFLAFWLQPWEKQAIVSFHLDHPLEGYRAPTWWPSARPVFGACPPGGTAFRLVATAIVTRPGKVASSTRTSAPLETLTRQLSRSRDHD